MYGAVRYFGRKGYIKEKKIADSVYLRLIMDVSMSATADCPLIDEVYVSDASELKIFQSSSFNRMTLQERI